MTTKEKFIDITKQWVGVDFNKGVPEQCAMFVRHMLSKVNIYPPVSVGMKSWDGLVSDNIALAASLATTTIGQKIPKTATNPGDILFFGGTYGGYGLTTVTHVAINIGDGFMVHRPTMARPVEQVYWLDGYWGQHFHSAIRLKALEVTPTPEPEIFRKRILGLESTKHEDGFKFFLNPEHGAKMVIAGKEYDCDYVTISIKDGRIEMEFTDVTGK